MNHGVRIRAARPLLAAVLSASLSASWPAQSFAADSASLQLSVASPDPVQSGGEVTFQVILANNGTEKWEAGRYYFEVQIYDSGKNYLNKTARILGEKDVPPGESALTYIPFQIPENYSGPYFYRLYLTHKEQRIYDGGFTFFSVTPLPPQPPKEKPVSFGGNVVVSYKTYSTNPDRDVANVNINSVGQVYGRSMLFNMNSQHTRPAHTKILQILLSYYGPISTMNLGDVQPNFSPLSLANSGARGIWVQAPIKNFSTEFVGAQSVFKITGSSTPARNGTFSRFVMGAQEKIDLPKNFTVAMDFVRVFDDRNSLSADPKDNEYRGPEPKEVRNDVISGGLAWKGFSQKLLVETQIAQSDFSENTLALITKTVSMKGQAKRMSASYRGSKLTAKAGLQIVDPDFRALAAPSAAADRQTMDILLGYAQPLKNSNLNATLSGNQFSDNIKSDPKKITTTQTTVLTALSLNNPKPWPGISLSVSINQGQDKTKAALDNQTQTLGLSITQPVGTKTSLALGMQQSQFKDNLKKSADLTTQNQSLSMNSALGSRINFSLGATLSKTDSQATKSAPAGSLNSNTYTVSANWRVIKEKLVAQMWMTMTSRSGTSSGTKQDVKDQSQNLELTYQLYQKMALTLGGTKNKTDDGVDSKRNVDDTILTGRITYTF